MLGVPDAYELPPQPGPAASSRRTPTAVDGSRPAIPSALPGTGRPPGAGREPVAVASRSRRTTRRPPSPVPRTEERARGDAGETEPSRVVVDRYADAGPPAHQVWLPPLDRPSRSTSSPPPLTATGFGCRVAATARADADGAPGHRSTGRSSRARDPLVIDLAGAAGTRRRRWPAERQDHPATDPHRRARAAPTRPRRGRSSTASTSAAVWPVSPACRTSAGSPRAWTPNASRRTVAEVPPCSTPASSSSSPHGIDSIAQLRGCAGRPVSSRPAARRRLPGRSTDGAPCARSSRISSRSSPTSRPAAWATASTSYSPPRAGPRSGPPCTTLSAAGWSCGWPTRSTPRSTARPPSG